MQGCSDLYVGMYVCKARDGRYIGVITEEAVDQAEPRWIVQWPGEDGEWEFTEDLRAATYSDIHER